MVLPEISEAETAKTLAGMQDVINESRNNNPQNTESDSSSKSEVNDGAADIEDEAVGVQESVVKAPPSIKDQRTIIEKSEAMTNLFVDYADLMEKKFNAFDIKGNKDNKSNISKQSIVESSKQTIQTPMKVFNDPPCKTLLDFAKLPYKYGMSTVFYKDMQNHDVFISPLKHLILKSDRFTLHQAATLKIPETRQKEGLSNYAFEVAFVDNIAKAVNRQIREQVMNLFTTVFSTAETDHIKALLQEERSKAAILINRIAVTTTSNRREITTANIMGAVLFATDRNKNLLIDFVCAAPGFFNKGYGVFLIHVAQVFGLEIIKQELKAEDEIPSTITTYLSCNNDLFNLYKVMGFEQVPFKEFIAQNGTLNYFGKRMEIAKWIEDPEKVRLKCLRIRKWCPRWISKLSPPALDIESTIYGQMLARFKSIKTPKRIADLLEQQFKNMLDSIKFRPVTQNDIMKYQSCKSSTQFIQAIDKELIVFKIGDMIKKCFTTESGALQEATHSFSTTTIHALEYLEVKFLFQDLDKSNLDTVGLWVLVQCSSCKKKCYCRKLNNENFVLFMTKIVYSIWYVHIFGFKNKTSDEWYNCNADWNHCPKRVGKYLHTMKESLRHDYRHLITDESRQRRLFIWKKYVESFFEQMGKYMITIYDGLVTFGIACEKEFDQQCPSSKLRPRRNKRNSTSDYSAAYTDNVPRYAEMTERDKNLHKARQRNKNKQERDMKLHRHTAEEMWQTTREDDTKLQLRFESLQYVDCSDTNNLLQESKDYLKNRDALKNQDYRDHHGDLHTEEHFIMYTQNKKSAHVIDDCWFKIYDENVNFLSDRITPSTVKKCKQHPNVIINLSPEDKKRIKKHVDFTMNKCQIHRIKRVRTNPKNDDDYETVTFYEESTNKRNKNNSTIVKHTSSSRYDFVGFDAQGRSHRLSRDWVELNFKGGPFNSFYRNTLSLKPGQNITVPDGSSNLNESDFTIDEIERGHASKYIQKKDEPSCLFVSISCALDYVGDVVGAKKIMDVYLQFFENKNIGYPSMKDVLQITNENKYHQKGEKRFKYMIQKVKKPSVEIILNDFKCDCIYHCTLANNHAICFHGEWIFDPILPFSYKRTLSNFRKAAEALECEETSSLMKLCYKYNL